MIRLSSILILSAVSAFADLAPSFDFTPYPECTEATVTAAQPKVPAQFMILAERKMLSPNGSMTGRDFVGSVYDSAGHRGAAIYSGYSRKLTYVWDFAMGDAYTITENLTCIGLPVSDGACNIRFAVFLADLYIDQATGVRVSDMCNLTVGPITFVGNETRRGIPVRKWKQCVYDQRRDVVSVNYYCAARDNLSIPLDQPVHFENKWLNRSNGSLFIWHSDDLIEYTDIIQDTSVFLPPSGSFCPTWRRENKTIPPLLNRFALSMVTVSQQAKEVHNMRVQADIVKKQVAFITDTVSGTRFPPIGRDSGQDHPVQTFYDYNTGVMFTRAIASLDTPLAWFRNARNCTASPIDSRTVDRQDSNETSSSIIRFGSTNQLFDMGEPDWIYVGERNFSNVRCYVWSRQQTLDNLVRITEVYWTKEEWSVNNQSTFFGMMRYRRHLNGSAIETYTSTVSDYGVLTRGTMSLLSFDVTSCLRTPHPILVSLKLKVQNFTAAHRSAYAFSHGLITALAVQLNVSNFRFEDMEFGHWWENVTDNQSPFWFTLLEWVNVTGRTDIPLQKTSREVLDVLKSRMTGTDYDVVITYDNTTETVTLLSGTLNSGADLPKPTPPRREQSYYRSTRPYTYGNHSQSLNQTMKAGNAVQPMSVWYTGGDMAGLAFAMIIIFGLAGAAVGYFIQRRVAPVPYHHDPTL